MDLPVNHFKRAIASGKTPIGCWLASGAPSTAEALGCVGFDFLVVDIEHTPIDPPQMIDILRTIAGTPAQAIVRPPWNDMVMVKRVLDAGALSRCSFPSCRTPRRRSARSRTRAIRPRACAAWPAMHRGSRYGTVPNYVKRAHEEICVIVQIETLDRLRAARGDRCGAGRGLDLHRTRGPVGVDGPSRRHGQPVGAGEAHARARRRASALGKPCGIVGANPEIGEEIPRLRIFLGRGRLRSRAAGRPCAGISGRRAHARATKASVRPCVTTLDACRLGASRARPVGGADRGVRMERRAALARHIRRSTRGGRGARLFLLSADAVFQPHRRRDVALRRQDVSCSGATCRVIRTRSTATAGSAPGRSSRQDVHEPRSSSCTTPRGRVRASGPFPTGRDRSSCSSPTSARR